MATDPLSLASSIIAFIEVVNKLKGTFTKVGGNKGSLRSIVNDVLSRLTDIQRLCVTSYSMLDGPQARELRDAIEELRSDLLEIHAHAETLLTQRPASGIFSSMVSTAQHWSKRSIIGAKVKRLEDRIRACQIRFMSFSSARTEYNLIVNHNEQLEHLEHIEDLVSYMFVQQSRGHNDSIMLLDPDEIDHQFAHRQVLKLVSALNRHKETWILMVDPENSVTLDWTDSAITVVPPKKTGFLFWGALQNTLKAIHHVKSIKGGSDLVDVLSRIVETAEHFRDSHRYADGSLLFEPALEILRSLSSRAQSSRLSRAVAFTQLQSVISTVASDGPVALSVVRDTARTWQDIYDQQQDSTNFIHLIEAISSYDIALFRDGQLEESLDCSLQALLLFRMAPAFESAGLPEVTWAASGEADVVFSSSREITRVTFLCLRESTCLWNAAKSLAFSGRYAEAQVAARDATSCRRAYLAVWFNSHINESLARWQAEIPLWVSIVDNPSLRSSASIEELDEPHDHLSERPLQT